MTPITVCVYENESETSSFAYRGEVAELTEFNDDEISDYLDLKYDRFVDWQVMSKDEVDDLRAGCGDEEAAAYLGITPADFDSLTY